MSKNKVYMRDGRTPIPKKEITSRIMSAIKGKNTKPELALRKNLWKSGLKGYRLHWKNAPGRPDVAFPGRQIAIFVNGCFWHRCPYCKPAFPKSNISFWKEKFRRNTQRDKEKLLILKKLGWHTLVIWECRLEYDLDDYLNKIRSVHDLN